MAWAAAQRQRNEVSRVGNLKGRITQVHIMRYTYLRGIKTKQADFGGKRTSDLTEDFSCKDFLSTGQFFNSLLIFQDFFSTPHREGWIDGLNSKVIGMLSCFYWSFFGFLSSVHHAEPIFIDLEKTLRPPGLTQSRVNDDEIENSPYLCSIQLANESFGISFILNSSLFLFKTTDFYFLSFVPQVGITRPMFGGTMRRAYERFMMRLLVQSRVVYKATATPREDEDADRYKHARIPRQLNTTG
ncbi:hypothetical protein PGT21_029973 [Puccinia graminis f. sp. tritici]|uniref:Uncharacterized protein n=1 Tax=Puccinia graminis f. sp. tritici TaxID=56615 RepID=A0A5B0PEI9_PUCGR|nr:hypothetical protein PGT21_027973 [Puccinia graminis f. sp. tritici]KAA1118028.1 hypothetical protein PGT21_029973 [Puccinia graminis f. sp. tritici]